MKVIATWQIEKGTTIGRVEQLLASHTVANTFISSFELRMFDLITIFVVLFWVFSPIGSQAALRVIFPSTVDRQTTEEIMFLDPISRQYSPTGANDLYNRVGKPMFTAAMLYGVSPDGGNTQDVWGNLRVPYLELMDQTEGKDGWMNIDDSRAIPYSSMVGVATNPKEFPNGTEFTLPLSYISLDCPTFTLDENGDYSNFTNPNSMPAVDDLDNGWSDYSITMTSQLGKPDAYAHAKIAISVGTNAKRCRDACEGCPCPARRLIWESESRSGITRAECRMQTTYADVRYACHGPYCDAVAARRSPDDETEGGDLNLRRNVTAFDAVMPGYFLSQFVQLYTVSGMRYSTPVIDYLKSPDEAMPGAGDPYETAIFDSGQAAFQERLTRLINTLHEVNISPYATSGYSSVSPEDAGLQTGPEPARVGTVAATVTTPHPIVRCSQAWLAVLLLASMVLVAGELASIVIRYRTSVPDILGTLSLATLDNRCGDVAVGGTSLDGMDRARLLKHVRVRLGDIDPAGPHGRIALSAEDDLGKTIGAVERSRLYH